MILGMGKVKNGIRILVMFMKEITNRTRNACILIKWWWLIVVNRTLNMK